MGLTHIIIGFLFNWPIYMITRNSNLFLASFLGSLFPDIDSPHSLISSFLRFNVSKFLRHRGFTHTFFCLICVTVLSLITANCFSISFQYVLCFSVGYFSHLIADSFTVSGVQLLSPFSRKIFSGPIKTGDTSEQILLVSCFFILFVLFFILTKIFKI